MSTSREVLWRTCGLDNCIGHRLPSGDRCWAHANEQALDAALRELGEDGYLDARGVSITQDLLSRLLAAAPHDERDRTVLTAAEFNNATFEDDAVFGGPGLGATVFQGEAEFKGVTFRGEAGFDFGVAFKHQVSFEGATFYGGFRFTPRTVRGTAIFTRATFKGQAVVCPGIIEGDAKFNEAVFETARLVGPLVVVRRLDLDHITSNQHIRFIASAREVTLKRARFAAGAQLLFRWADVWLDDAEFTAPSILAMGTAVEPGYSADFDEHVDHWMLLWGIDHEPETDEPARWAQPRLLSLCRADVANLTIADVDLRPCQFGGTHHLDQLRFDGETRFATSPGGWRWTRRQTLAEEHFWRHAHGAAAWSPQAFQPPNLIELHPPKPLQPAEIAAHYRALRKGREDSKDQPGAADFYYGEMEMRRHARRLDAHQAWKDRQPARWISSAAEYTILTLYWLVSGYALRAWRALTALLVALLLAAVGFAFGGFAAPQEQSRPVRIGPTGELIYAQPASAARPTGLDELPEALRFSARSATALLRGPERPLTPLGEWLEITVRLLGPVLIGLAILSIRGRVKR